MVVATKAVDAVDSPVVEDDHCARPQGPAEIWSRAKNGTQRCVVLAHERALSKEQEENTQTVVGI
jgi:hypothetical protein